MASKILFITILVAVLIISCRTDFTIDVCQTDKDVYELINSLEDEIIPLILIQNINAKLFENEAEKLSILNFYKSKTTVSHLVVVTANTCPGTDASLSYEKTINNSYPTIFIIKSGQLLFKKCIGVSLNNIEESYNYALMHKVVGRRTAQFLKTLEYHIMGETKYLKHRRKRNVEAAQSSTAIPQYQLLVPDPTGPITGPSARSEFMDPMSKRPISYIQGQWLLGSHPVHTQSSVPTYRWSVFDPVSNAANTSSTASAGTRTITPVTSYQSQELTSPIPDRWKHMSQYQGDTQTVDNTRISKPASTNPLRYEEIQTQDLLGAMEEGNRYHESDTRSTPTEYGGYENPTLDGTYARKMARSSYESSPGSSTSKKQTRKLFK